MIQRKKERKIQDGEFLKKEARQKDHDRKQLFLDTFIDSITKATPYVVYSLIIIAILCFIIILVHSVWKDWDFFIKIVIEFIKAFIYFIIGLLIKMKILPK